MEAIWDQNPTELIPRLTIDMALYFARFVPPQNYSDCYSRLLARIVALGLLDRVGFGTLNYECLLEFAAAHVGLSTTFMGGRKTGSLILWKLHGSCNFLPRTNIHIEGSKMVGIRDIFEGPIDIVQPREVAGRYSTGNQIPPAMSVYMPGKPTQSGSTTLHRIREEWLRWVESCQVVVVIGARPVLTEDYVWRPIVECDAEVLYIGGESEGLKQFHERIGPRFKLLSNRFAGGFDKLIEHLQSLE